MHSIQRSPQAQVIKSALAGAFEHRWRRTACIVLLSGLVFGVGFRLSISTFLRDNLAVCWPLVGLQAATLLCVPRRHWLPVFAGMVISQAILEWNEPKDEMIVDIIGDVAQVAIAVFCLPALRGLSDWMKQPGLLRLFVVGPMLLGPALTGVPVALVFSRELHLGFWSQWWRWFTCDMLGIVLWLPLGVVLMSRETYQLFRWEALPRTIGLIGLMSLAGWILFQMRPLPFAFLLMPLLLIIALKLGFSGSVIAVNLLSIVAARGTLHHLGPFGSMSEPYSVVTLQVFLAFSMLMCFPISIILLERDHFERKILDAYARMEQLAIVDGLTGLATRRHFDAVFDEEWRQAMRDGEPMAVMMIDVDCFKLYNDLYGHLAGDECLRKIADTILSTVRRAGDLAARFGGEEFVMLMPRTDLTGVCDLAETIRREVQLLGFEHTRNPHHLVTVSIGCSSIVPTQDVQPVTLIESADQGLYLAKQSGRNRVGILRDAGVLEPVQKAG